MSQGGCGFRAAVGLGTVDDESAVEERRFSAALSVTITRALAPGKPASRGQPRTDPFSKNGRKRHHLSGCGKGRATRLFVWFMLWSVTTYAYFAQNFALPLLAGLAVLILGTVKHWSWKKRWLTVFFVVLTALAISFSVTWEHRPGRSLVVAGMVVDDVSGDPIGEAIVELADGSQSYTSESNGNFRLDLSRKAKEFDRIRIHVTKSGYSSYDGTVEVSVENFEVRLHHL